MALATLGSLATKVLPTLIGWGSSKLTSNPIGQKLLQTVGNKTMEYLHKNKKPD